MPSRRHALPILLMALLCLAPPAMAAAPGEPELIRYFPAGPIYDFRWKLLELALRRSARPGELPPRLEPLGGDNSQSRAVLQLEKGELEVVALGSNEERVANLLR